MMIRSRRAFTFIEILVVLTVISFILPALFAIIFSVLRQEIHLYAVKNLKTQGDYALQSMKNSIVQNGTDIIDENGQQNVCPVSTSPTPTPFPVLRIMGKSLEDFSYSTLNDKIASESGTNTVYLTNDQVRISNLLFTCYRTNSFSPSIVTVSYIVSDSAYNTLQLPFYTSFQLKSY